MWAMLNTFRDEHVVTPTASGSACGSFCFPGADLYFEDRCWNKRTLCAIAVGRHHHQTIVVGQRDATAAGTKLEPGEYLTVLGPAAALGVGARNGFADELRDRLSLPVVNLGRGAAGPSDYLSAWPSVASLLAQSRAVLVVLMAGRSSANSAYPASPAGAPSGSTTMARDAGVRHLLTDSPEAARTHQAWKLINESLRTALAEYSELAQRIRSRAALLRRAPPPLLLLWFSECSMSRGCASPFAFPQWYVDPATVRSIAWQGGYTLVDASFGHVPPATPLPLDECVECARVVSRRYHNVCFMDYARRQHSPLGQAPQDPTEARAGSGAGQSPQRRNASAAAAAVLEHQRHLGCTSTCTAVLPTYYPHDEAHRVATAALLLALEDVNAAAAPAEVEAAALLATARAAAAKAAAGGAASALPEAALVPRIDLGRKLFFSHIHKAAGSSFTKFLKELQQPTWCEWLVRPGAVYATSSEALRSWWHAARPNCSLVSLESPRLGELLAKVAAPVVATSSSDRGVDHQIMSHSFGTDGTPSYTPPGVPQLVAFFRQPLERCRSSWAYEARLCLGIHRFDRLHVSYCSWWRATYAQAVHDPATHLAYAERFCAEHVTAEAALHGIDGTHLLLGSGAGGAALSPPSTSALMPAQPQPRDGEPSRELPPPPSIGLLNGGLDCWWQCRERHGCMWLWVPNLGRPLPRWPLPVPASCARSLCPLPLPSPSANHPLLC